MDRLTKLNGIGEFELQACFDCGANAGPDNENCGNCEKSLTAYQRLGEYEDTGLTPKEIVNMNDFINGSVARILVENGELERKNAILKKALELEVEESYGKPAPQEIIDEIMNCARESVKDG